MDSITYRRIGVACVALTSAGSIGLVYIVPAYGMFLLATLGIMLIVGAITSVPAVQERLTDDH